ncbi:MAG: hypothetical protein QG602_1593 [Verrucomicrobiota bacterium]|nr:hypothetical protein [Verrucomicrobiota bacterium]
MKSKVKCELRKRFVEAAGELDTAFSLDPSFTAHPNLVAVRRKHADQWQFIALSFSGLADRFFVEVAIATDGSFPIGRIPLDPESSPTDGALRFRACDLWAKASKSGGWLIQSQSDAPANDTVFTPEGVFETPSAALEDVKERMRRWILPYFASLAK